MQALTTQNFTLSGASRARTGDPRLAKPVLSQLSYVPEKTESQESKAQRLTLDFGLLTLGLRWAYLDSNQGPQLYQSCALTI